MPSLHVKNQTEHFLAGIVSYQEKYPRLHICVHLCHTAIILILLSLPRETGAIQTGWHYAQAAAVRSAWHHGGDGLRWQRLALCSSGRGPQEDQQLRGARRRHRGERRLWKDRCHVAAGDAQLSRHARPARRLRSAAQPRLLAQMWASHVYTRPLNTPHPKSRAVSPKSPPHSCDFRFLWNRRKRK